jgi:hypothetical protein
MKTRVRWLWRVGVLAVLAPASLPACGPWFPNTILDHPDQALLSMPEANFVAEIDALRTELVAGNVITRTNWPASAFAGEDPVTETMLADTADLAEALATGPLPPGERLPASGAGASPSQAGLPHELCCHYAVFRVCLSQADLLRATLSTGDPLASTPGALTSVEPPAGLPREFDLYARGAVAYHRYDLMAARRYWLEGLALPPAERRYRSTWYAYMLGRSWEAEEPDRAAECYRLVRTLVAAGVADSLGLAPASLGREARIAYEHGRLAQAARLYLEHYAAGDPHALISLQWVAERLFDSAAHRLPEFACDPLLQRVATAYLVSRGNPGSRPSDEDSCRWLEAVRQVGAGQVPGADRLAWLAYRRGDTGGAEAWLIHASPTSITMRWLSAKLLLRQGRKAEAEALLAGVIRDTDKTETGALPSYAATDAAAGDRPGSRPAGELAALFMADGRYVEALDLLWRHGWWTDAAYVAERVLTTGDLQRYVDGNCPDPGPLAATGTADDPDWGGLWDGTSHRVDPTRSQVQLRHVLARRLARAGALEAARAYYPAPWQNRMEEYRRRVQAGADTTRSSTERATAWWRAAQIARYWGMGLFGTELSPDWHLYAGCFQLPYVEDRLPTNPPTLAPPGPDESARVVSHGPRFRQRFHYRHLAAEHAWEAARLMPDESPLTARVLCEAGLWLKNRDPMAADRFYKALVRRCGTTELGREAKARRWFPGTRPLDHAWSLGRGAAASLPVVEGPGSR